MKPKPLNLNDLIPKEATLVLSEKPGKVYTLSKFSLYYQAWAQGTFGVEQFNEHLRTMYLPTIALLAHKLLKDSVDFPTADDLMKAIVTSEDKKALLGALLETIGISQPILEKISNGELSMGELTPPKSKK